MFQRGLWGIKSDNQKFKMSQRLYHMTKTQLRKMNGRCSDLLGLHIYMNNDFYTFSLKASVIAKISWLIDIEVSKIVIFFSLSHQPLIQNLISLSLFRTSLWCLSGGFLRWPCWARRRCAATLPALSVSRSHWPQHSGKLWPQQWRMPEVCEQHQGAQLWGLPAWILPRPSHRRLQM